MNKKRALLLAGIGLTAGLIFVGYFVYELIDTDAPDSVSTSAALDQIAAEAAAAEDESAEQEPEATSSTDVSEDGETAPEDTTDDPEDELTNDGGVIATWTVDNDFGDFDFETASGSFAGFRVDKSFFTGIDAVAVGRSGDVTGTVTIGDNELSSATITVNMTEIVSDESAREDAIKEAIMTDTFPTASFEVTAAVTLDTDALESGETVAVDVVGDLTVAGVTNQVTVPIEATLVEAGFAVIVGSTDLVWADYDVETPVSSVADVADEGTLEFQLIVTS